MKTKTCTKCGCEQVLSEFNVKKRQKDGLNSSCKECNKKYKREHKEQIKNYTLLHDKEIKAYKREYYIKNKKIISIKTKIYQEKNKDKYRQRSKNYQKNNIDKVRSYKLQKSFGITVENYNNLLKEQSGVCAICGNPETLFDNRANRLRFLAVDHDHKTGKVRGLLCSSCNKMLGFSNDNSDILNKAIKYLTQGA